MIDKNRYKKPTKYLSPSDLAGRTTVTIDSFYEEVLKDADGPTPMLKLRGMKTLRLNVTRLESLVRILGPDEHRWAEHQIDLVPGVTKFKGDDVATIFIQAPPQQDLPFDEFDGEETVVEAGD